MNVRQMGTSVLQTMTTEMVQDSDGDLNADLMKVLDDYITGFAVPCIGLVGIVGNVLNLAILSWRSWRRDDETMEKVKLASLNINFIIFIKCRSNIIHHRNYK